MEDLCCAPGQIPENHEKRADSAKLVSIIISNFNGEKHLRDCLSSLLELNYPKYEVIVVDAGSLDESRRIVKENFPLVRLIEKGRIGIGEAINHGITAAKGEIIAFDLNSDDIVDPDWLNPLVKELVSSPDIGIVCGKRLRYGANGVLDCAGGKINRFTGDTPVIGQGRPDSKEYSVQREVDYVPVVMTKRELISEIGPCDSSYYVYFEDTDFCLRARRAGYKIIYIPSAIFWHKGSATVGKFSYKSYYYLRRNQIRFIVKMFPTHYMIIALFYCLFFRTLLDSLATIPLVRKLINTLLPSFHTYSFKRNLYEATATQAAAILWNLKNLKRTVQARWPIKQVPGIEVLV